MSLNESNTLPEKTMKYAGFPTIGGIGASQMGVPVLSTIKSTLATVGEIISLPVAIGAGIGYGASKLLSKGKNSGTTNVASALLGAGIIGASPIVGITGLGAFAGKGLGKLEGLTEKGQRNMAAYLALAATGGAMLGTGTLPTAMAAYGAYGISKYVVSPLAKPIIEAAWKVGKFTLKNTVGLGGKIIGKGLGKLKNGFIERASVLTNPGNVFSRPQPAPVTPTPTTN